MGSFLDALVEADALIRKEGHPIGIRVEGYALIDESSFGTGIIPVGRDVNGDWYGRSLFGKWSPRPSNFRLYGAAEVEWCAQHNGHVVGYYPESCAALPVNRERWLLSDATARGEAGARNQVWRDCIVRLSQIREGNVANVFRGLLSYQLYSWRELAIDYGAVFVALPLIEAAQQAAIRQEQQDLQLALEGIRDIVYGTGIPQGSRAGEWHFHAGTSGEMELQGYCPQCGYTAASVRVYPDGRVDTFSAVPDFRVAWIVPVQEYRQWITVPNWSQWRPTVAPPVCTFCQEPVNP